ncbi:META domain-containing protein [Lentzea sp. NPDC051838]|uniref:META domain-containing protein n=1 Tax=Lentzea sp. NPDC051838 TaxID=3154849 RepID=UPI0034149806
MSYRVLAAVIAVALLATGCGNRSGGSAGQGSGDVQGKVFTSTSVTEQGTPRAMVEGTRVELRFTDDGRLLANAGCNQMQGPVTLDGGKLQVTDLSSTAMGCPSPDLHKQDAWLSKLLSAGPSWKMDGSNLVITGSGAEIVLSAEAPAKLEGGTWKLESLVQADAVSSVPGRVPATLKFADGKVSVFTGCNDGSASYKVDGQTITFDSLVHTDKACGADETAAEKAVVAALSGQATYKIDRSTLTLTNAKGEGVQFKK